MSHSPRSVDARSDAERHVARIRLGWISAGGFEQLLQPFMPRLGEFGETLAWREFVCHRAAARNRRSVERLLSGCSQYAAIASHRSQTRSAESIRPYCCGLCLILDAVVIDHDDVDHQPLRQSHGRRRVNAVVDCDKPSYRSSPPSARAPKQNPSQS
ncbi:MAG TPA: hypothetical protein VK638_03615 [Edaphobacter sp.]|nr:hypothetical protein [Edaphobacter sp.]